MSGPTPSDDRFTEVRISPSIARADDPDALLAALDPGLVAPGGSVPRAWIEEPSPDREHPDAILFPAVCFWVEERHDAPAWRAAVRAAVGALDEAAGVSFTTGHRALDPDAWRAVHRPFRVGRIAILPDGAGTTALRTSDVALHLPPGGAFGTGRHPTTRACLRALQRLLVPGQRLLDAGCGSGVLAVSAARLGAGAVVGLDVEEPSIVAATELATTHDVADRCTFRREALGGGPIPEAPFDGVLANIEDEVIRAHAGTLAGLVAPGGWFVVSGCRVERRDELLPTLSAAGLSVDHLDESCRWTTCSGTRRRQPAGRNM